MKKYRMYFGRQFVTVDQTTYDAVMRVINAPFKDRSPSIRISGKDFKTSSWSHNEEVPEYTPLASNGAADSPSYANVNREGIWKLRLLTVAFFGRGFDSLSEDEQQLVTTWKAQLAEQRKLNLDNTLYLKRKEFEREHFDTYFPTNEDRDQAFTRWLTYYPQDTEADLAQQAEDLFGGEWA